MCLPVEDVVGTVGELIHEGKVRHFGLSGESSVTSADRRPAASTCCGHGEICQPWPGWNRTGPVQSARQWIPRRHRVLHNDVYRRDVRNRVPRLTEKNPTANATLVEHVNRLGARTSPRAGCPWPVARTADLDRPHLPEPNCTSRIEENAGSRHFLIINVVIRFVSCYSVSQKVIRVVRYWLLNLCQSLLAFSNLCQVDGKRRPTSQRDVDRHETPVLCARVVR